MATIRDCTKIQPRLSEYVDGALPADTMWEVKLHLASCAVCGRVADELRATEAALRSLARQDTSASFEEALARRLAAQVLRTRRPSIRERLQDWLSTFSARPVWAAVGALAVLGPAALIISTQAKAHHPGSLRGSQTAATTVAAMPADEQPFLQECLEEHAAAVEPLGDPTAGLLASADVPDVSPRGGGGESL